MKKILFTLILISSILFSGCASLSYKFRAIDTFPKDKALVYIYRPNNFQGSLVSYDVRVGKETVIKLSNGGYYPYFSKPGKVSFWTKTESVSSVTLNLEPGKTYYIRGTIEQGTLFIRFNLTLVDPEVAEGDIEECRLIEE